LEVARTPSAGTPGSIVERTAAGPISWGVCEVPGWGVELPPDRVLAEMRELGIMATEAGPQGYLGSSAAEIGALLDRYDLSLVGGFVPVVMHERAGLAAALDDVRATARLFEELGATVLVSAAAPAAGAGPGGPPLTRDDWRRLFETLARLDEIAAEHGLTQALHPHLGMAVESADDVERVLEGCDVHLCLDTGHLALGGADPARLAAESADRVAHVHLKDVRADLAERVRAGELAHLEATRLGIFRPLGEGDVPIAAVVEELEAEGYDGWYVLEQDASLASGAFEPGTGPIEDQRRSMEYLRSVSRTGRTTTTRKEGSR
jgi:inosose dehydratase